MKRAALSFLGLTAVALAIALAQSADVLEDDMATRAIGLIVGVMIVVTGNLVPKLRPLSTQRRDGAAVAERFAGWALVLAGLGHVSAFAFEPLDRARFISAVIGIVAIGLIAVNWAEPIQRALSGGYADAPHKPRAAKAQRLTVLLLFAFFYVVATACTTYLFRGEPWFSDLTPWMTGMFIVAYAALSAVLERKRSCT